MSMSDALEKMAKFTKEIKELKSEDDALVERQSNLAWNTHYRGEFSNDCNRKIGFERQCDASVPYAMPRFWIVTA